MDSLVKIVLDGSYGGVRYFQTDPKRGLFCRRNKVERLSVNGASHRTSLFIPPTLSIIGTLIQKS